MAVITTLTLPGVSQQQYEQFGAALAHGEPSPDIIFHSCGSSSAGWQIVEVWASQQAWLLFLQTRFIPAACALGLPEPIMHEPITVHHAGLVHHQVSS